jgi:hypothetical protein
VAKKYGDARRDRTVFVRDDRGILQDRTQQYNMLSGADDTDTLRADLLKAIRDKWAIGQAFATSNGGNGLHARRFELAEAFHEKTRAWFEEQAGKMLADGSIKRLTYKGGSRYVPPEAESAIPKPAPEEQAERRRRHARGRRIRARGGGMSARQYANGTWPRIKLGRPSSTRCQVCAKRRMSNGKGLGPVFMPLELGQD